MQRLSFLIDIHAFLSGITFVRRGCIIALNMLWKGVFAELRPWGSAITGDHLSLLQNLFSSLWTDCTSRSAINRNVRMLVLSAMMEIFLPYSCQDCFGSLRCRSGISTVAGLASR